MYFNKKGFAWSGFFFLGISVFSTSALAAKTVDVFQHPPTWLGTETKELSKKIDNFGVTHTHYQQTVKGYPVWGADYYSHFNTNTKSTAIYNGIIYENLQQDLANASTVVFENTQQQKAIAYLQKLFPLQTKLQKEPEVNLIVFIAKDNIAHWAYKIRFITEKKIPTYIMDALSFNIYEKWNDLKTFDTVTAGGLGGNKRSKMKYYDGLPGHLPTFTVQRDPILKTCYVRNEKAVLKHYTNNFEDIQFSCIATSKDHPGLYWNSQDDYSGGGYSPSNDTLYAASITWDMFQNWYHMPMWKDKNGNAKRLVYFMHDSDANAAFHDDGYIVIGDALETSDFYPFTTIDIIAHEIGHGVTYQHANLQYYGQSGGLNESFSDMTGKTAEFYEAGNIKNWNLGEVWTDETKWLRYMDQPSKDCEAGNKPGEGCSIDSMDQWPADGYLDVHYSSGIFNRVFYLLSTTPYWNVKDTYNLMLYANQYYWTEVSSFCQAARGVMLAANELRMNDDDVKNAFVKVGIDPMQCA